RPSLMTHSTDAFPSSAMSPNPVQRPLRNEGSPTGAVVTHAAHRARTATTTASDLIIPSLLSGRSRPSAPVVDRRRCLVVAAHDPPVAVGLAADHHDVDVLAIEHRDQLVRRRPELGGVRLLTRRRARVEVVLGELVVPVLVGAHPRGVVDP